MHLDPTDTSAIELLRRGIDGPFCMLNLLRFRELADYATAPHLAPATPVTGRAAYERYVEHTIPFLTRGGGAIEFVGTGGGWFVGPPDERWDLVMMIRQASISEFFAFASDEDYLAGVGHRAAALEDSRLLAVVPSAVTD